MGIQTNRLERVSTTHAEGLPYAQAYINFRYYLNTSNTWRTFSPNTIRNYSGAVRRFIGWAIRQGIELELVSVYTVRSYLRYLLDERKIKQSTTAGILSAIKKFFFVELRIQEDIEKKTSYSRYQKIVHMHSPKQRLALPRPLSLDEMTRLLFGSYIVAERRGRKKNPPLPPVGIEDLRRLQQLIEQGREERRRASEAA